MSYDYDPERIVECETGAEALQWEAAERIAAGLDAGRTAEVIADEIGKKRRHIFYMAKVWRVHLGALPEDRPPFNEAYQAAKAPKPQPESQPEPS